MTSDTATCPPSGARTSRPRPSTSSWARACRFDQFYANCTVCTPTRASLMTGRYPDLVGAPGVIRQNAESNWGFFNPTGPTLPELMSKAGYHTGMVGKWHLGYESPNLPNDRGFEFFHGFLGDMMDDYWTHLRGGVNWIARTRRSSSPRGMPRDLQPMGDRLYQGTIGGQKEALLSLLGLQRPHFPIQPPRIGWRRSRSASPN